MSRKALGRRLYPVRFINRGLREENTDCAWKILPQNLRGRRKTVICLLEVDAGVTYLFYKTRMFC